MRRWQGFEWVVSLGCTSTGPSPDVNYLAVLVNGPVGVDPASGHPDRGLVDGPADPDALAMGARRVLIERGDVLHPIEDRRGVDLDAPCGQEFHKVGIGQTETRAPAHSEGDYVIGEAIAAEGRGGAVGLRAVTGRTLVDLPACSVAPGLLPPHQATAYPISARPKRTLLFTFHTAQASVSQAVLALCQSPAAPVQSA